MPLQDRIGNEPAGPGRRILARAARALLVVPFVSARKRQEALPTLGPDEASTAHLVADVFRAIDQFTTASSFTIRSRLVQLDHDLRSAIQKAQSVSRSSGLCFPRLRGDRLSKLLPFLLSRLATEGVTPSGRPVSPRGHLDGL
jgi:hypothetical protein